jgi:hypothetical protein
MRSKYWRAPRGTSIIFGEGGDARTITVTPGLYKVFSPTSCMVRLKHTLPDLSYDYNALEPVISAEIMQVQTFTLPDF